MPVMQLCDAHTSQYAFRATVYKSASCKGFTGYGDANPSNVSPVVRSAELRVAETRAVNRALRKAYGIAVCSVEELGSPTSAINTAQKRNPTREIACDSSKKNGCNGHGTNGNGSRVRDRLCQIIRQHSLDAELVKSYAIEFCGTKTLRREFCRPSRRLGREGPQCPALPIEQLCPSASRCRMKRYVSGLSQASASRVEGLPDGFFLVRIERARYCWHAQKPYFTVVFSALEPTRLAGNLFSSRLYCTPKALWKLNWFLRDFGYDSELLGRDEIDDKNLVGLWGVVKISHTVVNGTSLLNLDAFAPASEWEALSSHIQSQISGATRKAS